MNYKVAESWLARIESIADRMPEMGVEWGIYAMLSVIATMLAFALSDRLGEYVTRK